MEYFKISEERPKESLEIIGEKDKTVITIAHTHTHTLQIIFVNHVLM